MSVELFESITKFSPSVIYFFEPERSAAQLFLDSNTLEDTFMYQYMQTQDLIHAYRYAQDILLPEMIAHRNKKEALSSERLLTHLKELHRLSCQQVLGDNKALLGVYCSEPSFRWHYGALLNGEMLAYFSDLHEAKTTEEFSYYLNRYFKVPLIIARDFILLLESLKLDKTYESHPYFSALDTKIEAKYYPGICTLMKLNLAYHAVEKLSTAERDLIQHMVLPCLPPEFIPLEMEKFAINLLMQIQDLNIEVKTEVANFLAEVFYQFTLLHPFVNGNGRVAICFINLLLVAMNLPSIVIRMPGDTKNPKSDYVRAFLELEHSRALLAKLIENKLIAATASTDWNQSAYDLCCLRLNLLQALQRLQEISYPVNNLFKLGHFSLLVSPEFCRGRNHQDLEKIQLRALLYQAQQILNPKPLLLKFSITAAPAEDTTLARSAPLNQKDILELSQFLQDITGLDYWKYSHKGGNCFWLKVDSLKHGKCIEKLLLTSIPSLNVQLTKIKGMEDYVLQCSGIDLIKYLSDLPGKVTDSCLAP